MSITPARLFVALSAVGLLLTAAGPQAREVSQASGGGTYQVVPACSLLSLAEVKKLAPWEPHLDSFAKAEETPLGATGSACEYLTVGIQVLSFSRGTIEAMRKSGPLEPVAGVGEEAYIRSNRGRYAELAAKVGPHLVTVQLSVDRYKTFDAAKPVAIEIGKALAAKLR